MLPQPNGTGIGVGAIFGGTLGTAPPLPFDEDIDDDDDDDEGDATGLFVGLNNPLPLFMLID